MVGVKDRDTNRVRAQVVSSTDKATLQEFVWDNTQTGSTVYTDDAGVYQGLPDCTFTMRASSTRWRSMCGTTS